MTRVGLYEEYIDGWDECVVRWMVGVGWVCTCNQLPSTMQHSLSVEIVETKMKDILANKRKDACIFSYEKPKMKSS